MARSKKCIHEHEDLVFEILVLLPVKSILKFRCISKSWCRIISSKQFIDSQLDFSRRDPNFVNHYVVFTVFGLYATSRKQYSLNSVLYEKESAIEFEFPMIDPNKHSIVGYYNGLCCIAATHGTDVLLWNPATRKCNVLPPVHGVVDDVKSTPSVKIIWYGFGFADDDYKIILSYTVHPKRERASMQATTKIQVKLYSSRTNSWKTVADDNFTHEHWCYCFGAGELVMGDLHWLNDYTFMGRRRLVYFDLNNEVPGTLELPNGGRESQPMVIIGDQEHLFLTWDQETYMDVWKSNFFWEKVATVPYDPLTRPLVSPWFVSITPKGEILMLSKSVPTLTFVVYDPITNSVTDSLKTNSRNSAAEAYFLRIPVYIQSLVSPNVAA